MMEINLPESTEKRLYDSGYRMAKGFEIERLRKILWNSSFFRVTHEIANKGFFDGLLSREDLPDELRERVLFVRQCVEEGKWDNIDRFNKELLCEILRLKKIYDKYDEGEVIKVTGEGKDGRFKIFVVFLNYDRTKIKTILKVKRWDRPYSYLMNGQPSKNTEVWRNIRRACKKYPEYFC